MTGRTLLALAAALVLPLSSHAAAGPLVQSADPYFTSAAKHLNDVAKRKPNTRRAKNIILFVGDGMGITTVTAARIRQGQVAGRDGVSNNSCSKPCPIRRSRAPTHTIPK